MELTFTNHLAFVPIHLPLPECLIPAEEHHRPVQWDSVTDFQSRQHRIFWIVVFLIESILVALRCNSEPICPRSLIPFGTKWRT